MNKFINGAKLTFLSMTVLFVFSCSKDDEVDQIVQDQVVTSTEVQTIIATDDYSSAVDDIITDLFQNGESSKSSKNDCYAAEYSDTGYSVTFDNCSFDDGEIINGSLVVTYKEGEESSAFTATYNNLTVGDIAINGTRSFTINSSSEGNDISFDIVSDMSVKLADGSIIEEMGSKNFTFVFDSENFEESVLIIDGDWTVKADGNTYTVNITSPLRTNFFNCEHASEGVMSLNKNGLAVTIDFGDGTCDDVADMTYPDGTVEEIKLGDI